jgi:hypothetical protein
MNEYRKMSLAFMVLGIIAFTLGSSNGGWACYVISQIYGVEAYKQEK